jgi:hypothetical protein
MSVEPMNSLARALMDEEKAHPSGRAPDPAAAARVLERLLTLGVPPPPPDRGASAPTRPAPASAPASTAAALKVVKAVSLVLLGAGAGTGATYWAIGQRPPEVRVVEVRVPTPAPPAVEPVAAPPVVPEAVKPAGAALTPPARKPVLSSLKGEQVLLDTARAALINQRFKEALEALDRHARQFPDGALSEEREALAVQTLAQLDQHDAARSRADAFRKRYPASIFLPAVDDAVAP